MTIKKEKGQFAVRLTWFLEWKILINSQIKIRDILEPGSL